MLTLATRSRQTVNIWPGFVDALASVLLVFVFMLLIFVVSQFFLTDLLRSRFGAIDQLSGSVHALLNELSIERDRSDALERQVAALGSDLAATRATRDSLDNRLRLAREQAATEAASAARELALRDATIERTRGEVTAGEAVIEEKLRVIASLQEDVDALRRMRDGLEARVAALAETVEARDATLAAVRDRAMALQAELAGEEEKTRLAQIAIADRDVRVQGLIARITENDEALGDERRLTADARERVLQLGREVTALREQLARVSSALQLSEQEGTRYKVKVDELGEKLNVALAERVEELSRFRSDFFGRLRETLGERSDVVIQGDRFVFQSEVLFPSGSAELEPAGRARLDRLAETLTTVAAQIPPDLDWILRVDGHTDRRPIATAAFPSNWELSTARALSIVRHLIERGVAPRRLAAAGFGEFRPLDPGENEAAYARNRRIEIKVTGP